MTNKTCTKCNETKSLEQFGKDSRLASGLRSECKECRSALMRARYVDKKEVILAKVKEYASANKEKIAEAKSLRYQRDKDQIRAKQKVYAKENAEKLAKSHADWHARNPDKRKQYNSVWVERNKSHFQSLLAKYRANKFSATPDWADLSVIEFLYATRSYISQETGAMWHVDHIVPLQGKAVCGLHTHTNLRVVPAIVNLRKGNKFADIGSEI